LEDCLSINQFEFARAFETDILKVELIVVVNLSLYSENVNLKLLERNNKVTKISLGQSKVSLLSTSVI
jgi:hypothetical protein